MKITILTLFPEMFDGFLNTSIIKKARLKNLVEIETVDIRSFTKDKNHRVDDYPFGGGQGMILQCQPVLDALKSVRTEQSRVVLLSPVGKVFKQPVAREYVKEKHIILICGHYEGFDERILDYVDESLCIGDYVLTGGEVASMVVTDAVVRLVDGVITQASHEDESFENGLLEYPQYTHPTEYDGKKVPDVLLSGHHENIRKFRLKESLKKTMIYRPDLLEKRVFSKEEIKMVEQLRAEMKDDGANRDI